MWTTHRARINVPYLLELSSEPSAPRKIFLNAARYTISFCVLALAFVTIHQENDVENGSKLHVANRTIPLLLYLALIAALLRSLHTQRELWIQAGRSVRAVAPGRTRFTHTFIADWFTSLVKPVGYFAKATCYYLSGEGFDPCPRPGVCTTS